MKRTIAALLCCASAIVAQAMTVEEAYAAIPHQRTVFDARASRLTPAHVDTLQRLFALSDRGTVLRMEGLRALRAGNGQELRRILSDYQTLLDSLASAPALAEIKLIHELVRQAVAEHRGFFADKLRSGEGQSRYDAAFTPQVHQASQKLQQAYALLMRQFANEPAPNKTAFFDYLCALDFL